MTERRLRNIALAYLGRYEASAARLAAILNRRIDRAARLRGEDPDDARRLVAPIVEAMIALGYVDDARYTRIKAQSLLARGVAPRLVVRKLARDGIDRTLAEAEIRTLAPAGDETGATLAAAIALARRRRLGPYRADPATRTTMRQRDFGTLARQGFDPDTARRVLDAETCEDLEAMLDEETG